MEEDDEKDEDEDEDSYVIQRDEQIERTAMQKSKRKRYKKEKKTANTGLEFEKLKQILFHAIIKPERVPCPIFSYGQYSILRNC